jgi:hypothetical protein
MQKLLDQGAIAHFSILKFDLEVIMVLPEHIIACHPFVGKSFLHAGRSFYEEDEEDEEEVESFCHQ